MRWSHCLRLGVTARTGILSFISPVDAGSGEKYFSSNIFKKNNDSPVEGKENWALPFPSFSPSVVN